MDCNEFYIGQTSKTLETRKEQHKYSVKSYIKNNALFEHSFGSSHKIDWDDSKIIIHCNDNIKRLTIESALIKSTFDKNMNINDGYYKFDNILLSFVAKELSKYYNC